MDFLGLKTETSSEVEGDLKNTLRDIVTEEKSQLQDDDSVQVIDHVKIKLEENTFDGEVIPENWRVKQEQLHDELIIAEGDDMKVKDEDAVNNETVQDSSNRQEIHVQYSKGNEISLQHKIPLKENTKKKLINKKQYNNKLEVSAQSGGNKRFECEHCHRKFGYKHHLRDHMLIHTGGKPLKCKHCYKAFARKTNLKNHLLTHSSKKSFECNQCDKKFRQKSSLRRHVLKHTGEKSSEFEQCNKKLAQKPCLTYTGEKPLICEYCHEKFGKMYNLKIHLLTHYSFECKKCDKKFVHQATFERHLLTHTTEKYFKCKHNEHNNTNVMKKTNLGQHHFLQFTENDPKTNKKRQKRCKLCYAYKKRIKVTTVCDQCEGNPGFCIPCFKIFHLSSM